ncbi:MAG: hypothetical protein ACI9WU_004163 [Myxococcota bacterium]
MIVYSATMGYRHASIEPGVAAVLEIANNNRQQQSPTTIANNNGWSAEHTEDPAALILALDSVDAVVFFSTTGDVLDDAQQIAAQQWFEAGNGWVGVHAAADCEYDWPFYEKLVGAWFSSLLRGATPPKASLTHCF